MNDFFNVHEWLVGDLLIILILCHKKTGVILQTRFLMVFALC